MRRGSISKRITPLIISTCIEMMLCGINLPFGRLSPSLRQVTHVLLTRPPLIHFPKEASSLDLHVLSTPPAFVLSQDQTLNLKSLRSEEHTSELQSRQYLVCRLLLE